MRQLNEANDVLRDPDRRRRYDEARTARLHDGPAAAKSPIPPPLTPEGVFPRVAANLRRGMESVGGWLTITDDQLIFEPHSINIQRQVLELDIQNVEHVGKSNTFGIIPNGMTVRTTDGTEHRFVVWSRDRLISLIRSRVPVTIGGRAPQ